MELSRRALLAGVGAIGLTGCTSGPPSPSPSAPTDATSSAPASPTPTPSPTPPPRAPLTGIVVTDAYVTGGLRVDGTWSKGGIAEPFVLTTSAGAPLLLAPGRTWIELPRPTSDVLIG